MRSDERTDGEEAYYRTEPQALGRSDADDAGDEEDEDGFESAVSHEHNATDQAPEKLYGQRLAALPGSNIATLLSASNW